MTSPDPGASRREAVFSVLAVLLSALVVVTCAATQPRDPTPPLPLLAFPAPVAPRGSSGVAGGPAPPGSASASPGASSSAEALPSAVASAEAPSSALTPTPGGPLARFHGALAALEARERKTHVRILWLGDSHTAADLWTGEVRRALQRRYGDGGPGFVHVGWEKYRHEKASTKVNGKWRTEPGDYARLKRYDDGVQGLGGVRHVPKEPGAEATVELRGASGDEYTWTTAYRLPEGAAVEIAAGDEPAKALPRGPGDPGPILHHVAKTTGAHRVRWKALRGKPQLLGVTVEARKPGLILDTVGLNGARVGTFLGWEPEAWVSEATQRRPDLVVLAFGTNESSDVEPKAERYQQAARQLLERLRRAAPGADCLVVTPMDRAGAEYPARLAEISRGLAAAAEAGGCGVWSALEVMGGPGGMARWAAEAKPRGGADGIHLTARGYAALGESLARFLVPGGGSKAGLPPESKQP